MKCVHLCLALALGAAPATAQDEVRYSVRHWTISDGLPQGTINEILQGGDGELWIATFGGLLRFDGLRFGVLDVDGVPELPSNRLTSLADDGQGGLWAATQGGDVLRLRDGRVVEAHAANEPRPEIVDLVCGRDGVLWLRVSSGAVLRLEGASWSMPVEKGGTGRYGGLLAASDGTLLVARAEGLLRLAADGQQLETLAADGPVLCLARTAEGDVLLGLARGIALLRGGVLEPLEIEPALDVDPHAIAADGAGGFWLGGTFGLRHLVPARTGPGWRLLPGPEEFPAEFDVRTLSLDREGNLWIGAVGQGLARLTPRPITPFGARVGRGNVAALAEDSQGGTWVAYDCDGLVQFDAGSHEPRALELLAREGGRACVQSLLRDGRGGLWLGQGMRLRRLVGDSLSDLEAGAGASGEVGPMVRLPDDSIWVARFTGELAHYSPEGVLLEELRAPGEVRSLTAGPSGVLWIGGPGWVGRLQAGALEVFAAQAGLPRGDVRYVLPEADGSAWIASYGGGLGYFENGRVTHISSAQGLPDSSLSCILEDDLGRMWLLSNRGLIVVAREELLQVARGERRSVRPVLLGPESGVPEANFGLPSGLRSADGSLSFCTLAGVVRVDPSRFPFNRTPPEVRMERAVADDVALSLQGELVVPAGTRRLELRYTTFALAAPERVLFEFRLQGFGEDWSESGGDRSVTYTALPPGEYVFEVRARNEDGVWGVTSARLPLRVRPTWWQTRTFEFTAGLAVVLALLGVHRLRVAALHRRSQVLIEATQGRAHAEERESRLRDELGHVGRLVTTEGLAASLAHGVKQPLAAIVTKAMAARRVLASAGDGHAELDEMLADIVREGLRASEVIRHQRAFLGKRAGLRRTLDVNAVVRETLPLLRREFADHGVACEFDLAAPLPGVLADRVQLQQVLINLLKNACEAMGESAARRIHVSTRPRDGRVWIEVRDSGPGLAREVSERLFQPFVTTKPGGMGLGLSISRTIVEAHGGRLSADPVQGTGTCFRIDLPADPGGEVPA